jgi:hypothetical protein
MVFHRERRRHQAQMLLDPAELAVDDVLAVDDRAADPSVSRMITSPARMARAAPSICVI